MKKTKKNLVGIVLLAGIMTISGVSTSTSMALLESNTTTPIVYSIKANAANGRLYNQNDNQWKKTYYSWNGRRDNLYNSGCGLFSLANAIYALNGKKMNMDTVARWAASKGYYRPGSGGTVRSTLYKNAAATYGSTYDFKDSGEYYGRVTDSRLINWLRSGKVCVVHVSNHFMAITGYNASTKKYHVIESAVWSGRGLAGDSWVDADKLSKGNTRVDWYCLLEKQNTQPTPTPNNNTTSKTWTVQYKNGVRVWTAVNNGKYVGGLGKGSIVVYDKTMTKNGDTYLHVTQVKSKGSGSWITNGYNYVGCWIMKA